MPSIAKAPASDALQTALAFLRRTAELAADEARPVDGGWLIRAPSLGDVWGLNQLRLSSSISYPRAVELAEEHLGDLPYRQVEDVYTMPAWRDRGCARSGGSASFTATADQVSSRRDSRRAPRGDGDRPACRRG